MKPFFGLLLLLFLTNGYAQNIGINATGATPHASAMLDVSSTSKGFLAPRMTTVQRTAITSPATGLMVYDTDNNNFWFYNGSAWTQFTGANNGWSLTGNSGTDPSKNFIGTTDDVPLRFRVNNTLAGEINPVTNNVFFGLAAGNTTGTGIYNTGIGMFALGHFTTSGANTAIGFQSLASNTSGDNNTANGADALLYNTTGVNNTAVGSSALLNNVTGSSNTATGYNALLFNGTGSQNTANGYEALYNNTGTYNTAIGGLSLYANTSGQSNSAVGYGALYSNTLGTSNVAMGSNALSNNTTGNYNVALGESAMLHNTTGSNNIALGSYALYYLNGGSKNIAIGYNSGTDPGSPGVTNTISIGNDGFLNAANNQVFLGNFSSTYYGSHVSWSTFSDARIKTNIKDEVKGLDFIMRLHPVTYFKSIKAMVALTGSKETPDFAGKYDVEKIKFSGFLAQEVEQAANASGYDFSGIHKPQNSKELYALSYESFVVPLVKAMQEQQKIIDGQSSEINELKQRLKVIEDKLR